MNTDRRHLSLHVVALALLAVLAAPPFTRAADNAAAQQARAILDATHVQGGIIVHLGVGDGRLTAALRATNSFLVQGLDRDADAVAKARAYIQSLKQYGPASVDQFTGDRLPHADGLVNLIVADGSVMVPPAELMRVLAPRGVAYVKGPNGWTTTVKPVPSNIDDWTHYLYDAAGNAVSHDEVVGPPRHMQWLAEPRWSRHHDRMASMSALVSAGGRVIYIMDEGSRVSIELPSKWFIIARDAFNGTILWKRPINKWHTHLWPLKSGPTQLARRLVASDKYVFVTLGINEPAVALDAATGELVRTYEATKAAEEIVHVGNVLLTLTSDKEWELKDYAPQVGTVGDQARVAKENAWNKQPREIVACDVETGKVLWRHKSITAPLSLSGGDGKVYFFDTEKVVCLDLNDGYEHWKSAPAGARSLYTFNFGPKLVIYKGLALFAGGDRKMHAYDTKTGQQKWESGHERGGYLSPEDLLVSGGLIWSAPLTSGGDSGKWTGRDPETGEVKKEFAPDVNTYWFHHRCYITKATDKYLMPSRTGVEFVDTEKSSWDIHHWVRGGCLYGVMPANGLLYTPPHDCACYPEAKLFGFNALGPATHARDIPLPEELAKQERLEKGPAYGKVPPIAAAPSRAGEWPTYRHDRERSAHNAQQVAANVKPTWQIDIGGRLSQPVVAEGKLIVSQVDAHTIHAFDAKDGKPLWTYTAGGRVDSVPTVYNGMVIFGCVDGYVYCLRGEDGALVWRFRAAPRDIRLASFDQIESVWPVHGSVLVDDGAAYFVAGRSMFLDGGIRWYKLDAATGKVISEQVLDDLDPETKKSLQSRIAVLQMPVGLADILSADEKYVYMRSQVFDKSGVRTVLGPNSADAAQNASVQRGETAHIFSPTGFLDDTWFHRSYWVYGRSFSGGHNGFYQAGKFTPSGRIIAMDDDNVYGFARKPEYYKWTTQIEHQLFAASRHDQPAIPAFNPRAKAPSNDGPMIDFPNQDTNDPTGKPITVQAWIKADKPNGVVVARGGPLNGFALTLAMGKPQFMIRSNENLFQIEGNRRVVGEWTHLAGVLTADKQLQLYVNGKLVAKRDDVPVIAALPAQAMQLGADEGAAVGEYTSPYNFTGLIDEVRVHYRALSEKDIAASASGNETVAAGDKTLVLSCSFDGGKATDASSFKHPGNNLGATAADGKFGKAMQFAGGGGAGAGGKKAGNARNNAGGDYVEHTWDQDIPLLVQALVITGKTMWVAGPPDYVDEVQTFAQLSQRDDQAQKKLEEQDAALEGKRGALLWAVSTTDGKKLGEVKLDALPVWDGLISANGRLYMSTRTGRIVCLAGE